MEIHHFLDCVVYLCCCYCCCEQNGKALAVGIESLTLEGGGSVEDVDLDFTLPGCSDIELKVSQLHT